MRLKSIEVWAVYEDDVFMSAYPSRVEAEDEAQSLGDFTGWKHKYQIRTKSLTVDA